MRFDGYPKYVAMAAAECEINGLNPDGTVNPTARRILDLTAQNRGLTALATLIGQAADPRNSSRRAILAVAQQHGAALTLAAHAAELMLAASERAMNQEDGIADPEQEPDTVTTPPESKQPSKRR